MISAQHHMRSRNASPGHCLQVLYTLLLLWTEQMDGLADFSNYLFRIISSHTAQACDGDLLLLKCPRHSTIAVQTAFYGQRKAFLGFASELKCQSPRNLSCSASTVLQKVLAECQGLRDCRFIVNPRVFGKDPCPGVPKYIQVSYRCKPTEHRKKVTCEGDQILLHCENPKRLNIYSAVYGRPLEEEHECRPLSGEHPPFECLFPGAVDVVSDICDGKKRCLFNINEGRFTDPCPSGTRKLLSVLYACVSLRLLKEAVPNRFHIPLVPNRTSKGRWPVVAGSKRQQSMIFFSNSLLAYGFIAENLEMTGLLFTSSVCVGLLLVLIAVSTRLSCHRKRITLEKEEPVNQLTDEESEMEPGRRLHCWEDVTYTTEAAERMERMERRELVMQEIRMSAYLHGYSCNKHSNPPTIIQNVH